MLNLLLKEEPLAQPRHRHYKRDQQVFTFDPKSKDKKRLKGIILFQALANGHRILQDRAIYMDLCVYSPIPRSWSKRARIEAEGKPKITKPDMDNVIKLYMDVMNGIIYDDDKQITCLSASKFYSENPRVEISICPLEEHLNQMDWV